MTSFFLSPPLICCSYSFVGVESAALESSGGGVSVTESKDSRHSVSLLILNVVLHWAIWKCFVVTCRGLSAKIKWYPNLYLRRRKCHWRRQMVELIWPPEGKRLYDHINSSLAGLYYHWCLGPSELFFCLCGLSWQPFQDWWESWRLVR